MTYAHANLKLLGPTVKEMHLQENTFVDLGDMVTQNVPKYHQYPVICAPAKFEIATSNGLGGYSFTSKTII